MSEQHPLRRTIHLSEPGAWNWLAATLPYIVKAIEPTLHVSGGSAAHGALFDIASLATTRPIGSVVFNRPGPGDAPATATITSAAAEHDTLWEQVIDQIQAAIAQARVLRRGHEGVGTAEAIEIYYRSRAAGARTTLRDLAEQYNLPLGALKTAKRRYDAAGGWGSKEET